METFYILVLYTQLVFSGVDVTAELPQHINMTNPSFETVEVCESYLAEEEVFKGISSSIRGHLDARYGADKWEMDSISCISEGKLLQMNKMIYKES